MSASIVFAFIRRASNGLDDISLTAEFLEVIQPFETAYRQEFSWMEAGDKS